MNPSGPNQRCPSTILINVSNIVIIQNVASLRDSAHVLDVFTSGTSAGINERPSQLAINIPVVATILPEYTFSQSAQLCAVYFGCERCDFKSRFIRKNNLVQLRNFSAFRTIIECILIHLPWRTFMPLQSMTPSHNESTQSIFPTSYS